MSAVGNVGDDSQNKRLTDAVPPMLDHDTLWKALDFMLRHGGSFVSSLASAWLKADAANSRLLWISFHHYALQYDRARELAVKNGTERELAL